MTSFNERQAKVEALSALLSMGVMAGASKFATSLVSQYTKKGSLSSKQWYFLDQLLEDGPSKGTGIPPLGGVALVLGMFKAAAPTVGWPKIKFRLNGKRCRIYPANSHSANAGCLYLAINGEYAGKVSPDGSFTKSHACTIDGVELLKLFAQDPLKVIKDSGQETQKCAFCSHPLDDEPSLAVGYGPICAKHYQLPWGVT